MEFGAGRSKNLPLDLNLLRMAKDRGKNEEAKFQIPFFLKNKSPALLALSCSQLSNMEIELLTLETTKDKVAAREGSGSPDSDSGAKPFPGT